MVILQPSRLDELVRRLVRWYVGTLVRWYVGTLVRWYVGTLVRWYVGTLVRRFDWLMHNQTNQLLETCFLDIYVLM